MSATIYNLRELLTELSLCDDERMVTADRLITLFGSRLSYKELSELLCDYIVSAQLHHNAQDCQFIGELMIKLRVMQEELKSLNERYHKALTTIGETERKCFKALNEAAALKLQNIELNERLNQDKDQNILLHYAKEEVNA